MLDMTTKEPAAEVRQQNLFQTPVFKIFELQDAIKEDKKMVKEMETDYPIDLEELIQSLKDLQQQVKERKEGFIEELKEDNDHYNETCARIVENQVALDGAISDLKQVVSEELQDRNMIDEVFDYDGEEIRFQALKTQSVEIALNGKDL